MAKKKKVKLSNSPLWSALLYIAVGALLMIFNIKAIGLAMTIAGIFFIAFGVLDVLAGNMIGGAAGIIIGIVIITLGWTIASIVFLVLGVLIAIKGLLALNDALKRKKKGLADLLFPILTIVMGLMLAFGNGVALIIIIGGALMVIDGVLGLLAVLKK